jgi:hypothetical protein
MNIWLNGRIIQQKMPAGKLKHTSQNLERKWRNSWKRNHEYFV